MRLLQGDASQSLAMADSDSLYDLDDPLDESAWMFELAAAVSRSPSVGRIAEEVELPAGSSVFDLIVPSINPLIETRINPLECFHRCLTQWPTSP